MLQVLALQPELGIGTDEFIILGFQISLALVLHDEMAGDQRGLEGYVCWKTPDSVTASYLYGCGFESAELRESRRSTYDGSSKKDAGGLYKLGGSGAWD